MRKIYMILGLWLSLGVCSCLDDSGDYDYSALNKITITGLAEEYTVDQFDTLWVDSVNIDFALHENAELGYEWVVDGKVISTDLHCGARIENAPKVYNSSYLCVTDKTNNLKYYHEFALNVNTIYEVGLYILSEEEDGKAVLSMQRRDKENAPLNYDVYAAANPDLGILGKKPVKVACDGWMGSSMHVFVVCAEGEHKVSELDYKSMLLNQYWNENVIEGYSGELVPEDFDNTKAGLLLSEGKVFTVNYFNNRTMYRPLEGYNFSWVGGNPTFANSENYGFDEDSQKFMILENTNNALIFDVVTPLDTVNTQGKTFRNVAYQSSDGMAKTLYPVLYDPSTDKEHFYELYSESFWNPDTYETTYVKSYREVASCPAIIGENGVCLFSNMNYWFIAKGNKVSRCYMDTRNTTKEWNPTLTDWTKALEGEITAMLFDEEQSRIFIAAYNGTDSYIHEFDAVKANTELSELLEVKGRVVSMCTVGNWNY